MTYESKPYQVGRGFTYHLFLCHASMCVDASGRSCLHVQTSPSDLAKLWPVGLGFSKAMFSMRS